MAFTPITHLRHADFAVPDHAEQCEFYGTQWGLVGTTDGSDVTYFAAEGSPEQYVVRVRRADSTRIDLPPPSTARCSRHVLGNQRRTR